MHLPIELHRLSGDEAVTSHPPLVQSPYNSFSDPTASAISPDGGPMNV